MENGRNNNVLRTVKRRQTSCFYGMWRAIAGIAALVLGGAVGVVAGQLDQQAFKGSLDHPAIEYATRPLRDPVARLNREITEGRIQLPFEPRSGFLRGVLRAP